MMLNVNCSRIRTCLIPLVIVGLLATCGSGSSGKGAANPTKPTSTSRPTATRPLRILLTNDDGYDAPGIDVVAQALEALPDIELTIVAPATNKSGTGSQNTPGTLTASNQKTASGLPATAVDGFPADAVRYGLDTVMTSVPDVVVAGINQGQNLGPITQISGTVGAAKAAAAREIPAIAASQGLGVSLQYEVGARLVVSWITEHRVAFITATETGNANLVGVVNLNIPTCATGSLRGVKNVPLATDGTGATVNGDCSSTVTDVTTDIAAFLNGFASVTQLDAAGAAATPTTTFPPLEASGA